ncbi:MAG: uncharacterized protein QG564_876 [Campylobacterota bacterium]|nr:uncharacterized protein [Campylobacterota bacterium]
MANHLKNEHSPYLQQHAHNPVDWYPWGEEAFKKAKKEHKPIFLSIGYSSCHWCHVMERESFENKQTAKILNEHFVSIKVDREERPDIDRHFQGVYQLINSRPGGWPASIFLTEELKPFYAATYIPPEPRYGMISFESLLEAIAQKYHSEKELLVQKAEEILTFLSPKIDKIQATKLDESIMDRFLNQAKQLFDYQDGGFNQAPKFPQASILDLLLDLYVLTKDTEALSMSTASLLSMAKGGLYDRVEGGFCRYSTDNQWLVPHFEKMTYDNALLAEVYLKAYYITQNNFYKTIAFDTLDFMLKKMSQNGLFYSASDADTEGEEGKYFVYTYEEALKSFKKANIPSNEHAKLLALLHITKEGNFEGKNIIRIEDPQNLNISFYGDAIGALKKRREKHTYPFIDKKVIVSWNAMMIKVLFKAGRIDRRYLKVATDSLDRLLDSMYIHSQLFHSTLMDKKPKIHAFLEDYAFLGDALIEAYKSTLDERYLITATKLANNAIEKYYAQGKWKFSRGEFETNADIYDSSYPSSVSTMLSVLLGLSSLVDIVYKKFVFKTLELNSYDVMRQPISAPKMSHMTIRYLKDDLIIKANKEILTTYIDKLDGIPYPFALFKNDLNNGFMLCNSSSSFGHEDNFDQIINYANITQAR